MGLSAVLRGKTRVCQLDRVSVYLSINDPSPPPSVVIKRFSVC